MGMITVLTWPAIGTPAPPASGRSAEYCCLQHMSTPSIIYVSMQLVQASVRHKT